MMIFKSWSKAGIKAAVFQSSSVVAAARAATQIALVGTVQDLLIPCEARGSSHEAGRIVSLGSAITPIR